MKNLLKIGLCTFVFFLFCSNLIAHSKKDFENFLKSAENVINEYSKDMFYEKFEFTNKKTGVKKKFADFTDVEKQVFIIMQGQKYGQSLADAYDKWDEELKTAENNTDNDEASRKDIEAYKVILRELQKKNAIKLETLAEDLFRNNPTQFSKEEQDFVLKSIKDFHDKHNLIQR